MKQRLLANLIILGIVVSSFGGIMPLKENMATKANADDSTYCFMGESESIHYSGSAESSSSEDTITFDHKTVEEYFIPGNLPTYFPDQSTTNCANIAGAELIAYYDKTYESLVPNYQVYTHLGSVLRYRDQSSEIEEVIHELYTLMGTDIDGAGTTFSGFEKGMKQYALNHGNYTYQSQDLRVSGKFNLDNYIKAVKAEKPVALFLPKYTMIKSMIEGDKKDVIYSSYNTLAHVVAACGYRIDTYYYQNGNIKLKKTYLKVASGFPLDGLTYIEVDTSTFNEVISIMIS